MRLLRRLQSPKVTPNPQTASPSTRLRRALVLVLLTSALPAAAWQPPTDSPTAGPAQVRAAQLNPEPVLLRPDALQAGQKASAWNRLATLDLSGDAGLIDARSGNWASLWLSHPILPGAGNALTWADSPDAISKAAGEGQADALTELVRDRLTDYLVAHRHALRIEPAEIRWNVGVHDQGRLIQVHGQRILSGLEVRDAYLTASIVAGNLVLFGTHRWGTVDVEFQPTLDASLVWNRSKAGIPGAEFLRPAGATRLEIIPMASADGFEPGHGYSYRLAWVMPLKAPGAIENYRATLDAHTGELLELVDTNHYNDHRNVQGGVYPISSDGMLPDGVEIAGWPMPFADVTHSGGTDTTDAGGNVQGVTGSMTTALSGPYIRINESCGSISETSADGDLALGTSGGTDCTTPPGGSAGNTHSARTAFYELNRIAEMGRTRLPSNPWLQTSMPAGLNDDAWCNAVWTGSGVQFFQTEAPCANLGELAGVLDHEWGHGMDDNGTNGSVSSPGEGIADVFAALRLGDSCPGRGALPSVCSGFGDPCTPAFGCTAARDIDWQRHNSQAPHDVAWANSNCGGSSHCQGVLSAEAMWDLYKLDLPAQHGYDDNTSMEIATRLVFLGADNVGTWNSLASGNEGGCAATHGYQQFLVADDDNGNLADGTPHMQAIFNAFNRHGIACSTPSVQVAGCAGVPTAAPAVTAVAADHGAGLSWNAVAGADRYKIYRGDGVRGCARGKALVGEVTGTSFDDSGLQNGREYYYVVAGFTGSDACMGPASPCTTVTAGQGAGLFEDGFESGNLAAWSSASP